MLLNFLGAAQRMLDEGSLRATPMICLARLYLSPERRTTSALRRASKICFRGQSGAETPRLIHARLDCREFLFRRDSSLDK